jgi:hypothetical protein
MLFSVLSSKRRHLIFFRGKYCAIARVESLFILTIVGDCDPVLGAFGQSETNRRNASWTICNSDDSISGFQFRYDIDTILTKYRDIDTISIFHK